MVRRWWPALAAVAMLGATALPPAPARADLAFGPLSAVAAGGGHSCAIAADGAVHCWGANASGQLGDGSTTASATAHRVRDGQLGGEGLVQLDAGGAHTCVVDEAGDVYCWGDDSAGQLGDGGGAPLRTAPTEVGGALAGAVIVKIAAGGAHTCALTDAGDLYCWGDNASGQLGDGTLVGQSSPVLLGAGSPLGGATAVDIAAGGTHACAILDTGAAYCWGDNGAGQLGDGTTTDRPLPTQVTLLGHHLTTIAAGLTTTCATDETGDAYCWGGGAPTPAAVPLGGATLYQVSTGDGHACGLTTTLTARCWTGGAVTLAGLSEVDTYAGHVCAGALTGGVYCWGDNTSGQLGDGTTASRPSPTPVQGLPIGPTAPRAVHATPGDRAAYVSWGAPASLGTGTLAGYVALAIDNTDYDLLSVRAAAAAAAAAGSLAAAGSPAATGDGFCVTVSARHCTLDGLANGTTYVVLVLALTTVGFSAPSAPATVRPDGVGLPATGTPTTRWALTGAALLTAGLLLTYATRTRLPRRRQ